MSRRIVSNKNLPARSPLVPTLVFWLVLERLDAPGWVWGTVGTIMVLIWICVIVAWCIDEPEEVFK